MKDLSLSLVAVLLLALGVGLTFQWLYPQVALTSELAALFAFIAVVLKLVLSKLWSLRSKRAPAPVDAGAGK